MKKKIILESSAPIEEFLNDFSMQVWRCDSKDTILFDKQFFNNLRNMISKCPDCNKESSYLFIKYGKVAETQIILKNGLRFNFSYYINLPNKLYTLKELKSNVYVYYRELVYPHIDYRNPKNNCGEEYKIEFS